MSLIKSYLSVLTEEKKSCSCVAADNTGELDGAEKAKKMQKNSGPDAVKDLEKPVKGPHSEVDPESLPQSVKSESKNPFDLLFNKIIAQEAFGDLEPDAEGDNTFDFSGDMNPDQKALDDSMESDDLDLENEEGDEDDMEGEEEGELEGLEAVLDHLKQAVSALEAMVSEEEGEEEEGDEDEMEGEEGEGDDNEEEAPEDDGDFDVSDEDSGEGMPVSQESVDAEVEGHALVDQKKLEKSLNDKKSGNVKGAVPVKKGKAQVPSGKKVSGRPEKFTVDPHTLTKHNKQNVGGVKVGKGLFDQ